MELLFEHCLTFGLITFGFDAKEKSKLLQEIRSKSQEINTLLNNLRGDLESLDRDKRESISRQAAGTVEELKRIVADLD